MTFPYTRGIHSWWLTPSLVTGYYISLAQPHFRPLLLLDAHTCTWVSLLEEYIHFTQPSTGHQFKRLEVWKLGSL
jgi:hypothetical protein